MDDRPTFQNFAKAFWRSWFALMSGIPSVPVAIGAFYLENTIAKIALWVTAAGCLILSAYSLWKTERTKVQDLQTQLAKIREDRPLSFTGLALERCVQPRPPYGEWIIERIELGFENTGAERISWTLKEFFFEYGGTRRDVPLPAAAGRYCLLAREAVDYGFDVPGLQIQVKPLGVPTTVRFGFSVEYDNVPPLKVRRMGRVIDCNIRNPRPTDPDWNIIEQREC